MTLRRAVERLFALAGKRRLDGELDDEILAHLELAEREGVARGLSPAEARLAARRSFGGIEQVKEEHRESRSFRWIETLARDLAYGLASVRRAPGFAAVVVGVLALGIGANVAMFSVVDAVLLKPLPFAEPDRIAGVWEAPRPGVVNATTPPDFLNWKRLATVFDALSAEQSISAALTGSGRGDTALRQGGDGRLFSRIRHRYAARPHIYAGRRPAGGRSGYRAQPRRLAESVRRGSRHFAAPAGAGRRSAPGDRRACARRVRSGRHQILEAADLHARPAIAEDSLAHGIRTSRGRHDPDAGAGTDAGHTRRLDGKCAGRGSRSEHRGGALRPAAGGPGLAAFRLGRLRRSGTGAADRLRQCCQSATGQGRHAPQGTGRAGRPGRRPLPAGRAVVYREPGVVPAGRDGGDRGRRSSDSRGDTAACRNRFPSPPP